MKQGLRVQDLHSRRTELTSDSGELPYDHSIVNLVHVPFPETNKCKTFLIKKGKDPDSMGSTLP